MGSYWRWGIALAMLVVCFVALQWPDNQMRLIMCDVGQGDAILFTHGFTQVLVDGGPDGKGVMQCLGRHLPFWDRTIEMVALTHLDSDHAQGMVEVMRRFAVTHLLSSDTNEEINGLIQQQKMVHIRAYDPVRVKVGALAFEVLWPNQQFIPKDENEGSMVLSLGMENRRVLLMGDAPESVEARLLEAGKIKNVEVVKIGHHGAKTSSSQQFIDATRPLIALIGVGKQNRYGHPHATVIDRLLHRGINVYRTDNDGEVVLVAANEGWLVE